MNYTLPFFLIHILMISFDMKQLQGGYILEPVKKIFSGLADNQKISGLLRQLSFFNVEYSGRAQSKPEPPHSLIFVLENLLTRGLPAKTTVFIEDVFHKLSSSKNTPLKQSDKKFSHFRELLVKSLYVIDPRTDKKEQVAAFESDWDSFKAKKSDQFLYSIVPEFLGGIFLQLFEREVSIEPLEKKDIFPSDNENSNREETKNINLSFVHEYPYPLRERKGISILIEDKANTDVDYKGNKRELTERMKSNGWGKPFIFDNEALKNIAKEIKPLKELTENPYFNILQDNFDKKIYQQEYGAEALELSLAPFAIARVQRVIIEAIIDGKLNIDDKEWKIGVIERDVPCGLAALEDLFHTIKQLKILSGEEIEFPSIKLYTFYTEEFKHSRVHQSMFKHKYISHFQDLPIEKFSEFIVYNLLIDVSMLMRTSVKASPYQTEALFKAVIRSTNLTSRKNPVRTGHLIKYQPILKKINTDETITHSRLLALARIYDDLFRTNIFKPGQEEILNYLLQLRNCVGCLSSAKSKTHAWQLAGLLQPGIVLVMVPDKTVAEYHNRKLKNMDMEAGYIPDDAMTGEKTCMNEIINSIALSKFLFCTPEFALSKNFALLTKEMFQQDIYFSYCILENAECLSQWSHDFKPAYSGAANNILHYTRTKNTSLVPVCGLTGLSSYDVISDIAQTVDATESSVINYPHSVPDLNQQVTEISCSNVFSNTPRETALNQIGSRKQVQISQEIRELFKNSEKNKSIHRILIYCPETKGLFGISDENMDGLYDKLKQNFPEYLILHHQESEISENALKYGENNNFTSAEKNVNTKTNHVLILKNDQVKTPDFDDYNHVIFFNMPYSVDHYISQLQSINMNNGVKSHIFFNNQPLSFIREAEVENDNGSYSIQTSHAEMTIEKYFAEKRLRNYQKTKKHDDYALNEFFDGLNAPFYQQSEALNQEVCRKFEKNINLSIRQINGKENYSVYDGEKLIGDIHFSQSVIQINDLYAKKEDGGDLLNFLMLYIQNNCPDIQDFQKWLDEKITLKNSEGILKLQENKSIGEQFEMSTSMMNDKVAEINSLLRETISEDFTYHKVLDISRKVTYANEFINELNKIADVRLVNKKINLPERLQELFYLIRNEEDTLRAIYRLSIIGLVDAYQIDNQKEEVTITISKKEDKYYRTKLYQYFLNCTSVEYARNIFRQLENYTEDDLLKQAAGFLLQFYHHDIAQKQREHLMQMEYACNYALKFQDYPGFKSKINNDLSTWFHAKYAGYILMPSLRNDLESDTENAFQTIRDYISTVDKYPDKWRHLFETTKILLEEYPENPVLLILNAYSGMLIYASDPIAFRRAFDNMVAGFVKMANTEKLSYHDYILKMNTFLQALYKQNSSLKDMTEPLLSLKTHTIWLTDFNSKFLSGLKRLASQD